MPDSFDEGRLDDEAVLGAADHRLRSLAEAGARVRREAAVSADIVRAAQHDGLAEVRPRAVVAAGPDSRLLRAVLEPTCPVPFVAWPAAGLPGWAGSLDLVVMLAPEGRDVASASAVAEAVRRGCQVVVACPEGSLVAEHAAGRHTVLLPTVTGDQLAVAVVVLEVLHRIGLAPESDPEVTASALDQVAIACSPHRDLVTNPAKSLAIALADAVPLLWGGSVLGARAARRIAERLRRATGRTALAGDADHLLPLIEGTPRRDVFADPFDDPDSDGAAPRPVLVVLEEGAMERSAVDERSRLEQAAAHSDVRLERLESEEADALARYAALVATGAWAAEYLALGRRTH